ncbi:hypothetical protein UFOVP1290_7 [uncultured Caudovirales phage]|uniref:Uncharacterized protein n=1 Tax=uncultured Caudovirales phage TaxID=2100421 RepID=A0A6J5RQC9_9CAUD|nr:hypothetical protein UFOVP1290_7 [uncultured Caudovirales phage]
METLQALLSWQFILFGLCVFAVVFILRTIMEYMLRNFKVVAKKSRLWNELMLPIAPPIIGVVMSMFGKSLPYPENLTTFGGKIEFGLVAGLLSGLIYRVVKSFIASKITPPNKDVETQDKI